MRRLLLGVSNRDSYGLPVGPLASSVLAEAILIDVDAALVDAGFDFVRWFDDYTFFVPNETHAQRALFVLAEWLHNHHGLTLNPAKTKILARVSFQRGIAKDYERRIKDRAQELRTLWELDPYGSVVDLAPEQRAELESLDLATMLSEALSRKRTKGGVDYEAAAFILGRLSAQSVFTVEQAMDLSNVVIKHISHLYPIISSVAGFFTSFEGFSEQHHAKIANALLEPFKAGAPAPPDFVAMWILSIFASSDRWNHAPTLRRIYTQAASPVVRRYAALALASNGTRSHALTTRGDLGAPPLVRTAILKAWHKLGEDERKHWMVADGISDPLEKAI